MTTAMTKSRVVISGSGPSYIWCIYLRSIGCSLELAGLAIWETSTTVGSDADLGNHR
jgi:hypothetical protein